MPTIEQIKAARALLGWSQGDLAKASGLSQTGIGRIENGENKPNAETTIRITEAFGSHGIEFIIGGVRKVEDRLEVIDSRDCLKRLQDDVFKTLSNPDTKFKEVLIMGIDELTEDEGDDYTYTLAHIQRLKDAGLSERIIVQEGADNFIAPKSWYRFLPKNNFSKNTIFIYGTKIALVLRSPIYKALILDNAFFADNMRNTFNFVWQNAELANG